MSARRFFLEHGGKTIPIGDEEVRIGNGPDCTVKVSGKEVEPLVAVVRRDGDRVVLETRAREHEAKVNGKPLSVADLEPGAELRLGDLETKVRGSGVDLTLESSEGTFPIKVGANLVGRVTEAAVMLDHPTVSRKHALIFLLPNGQVRVRDLGAGNGTFVNGARLGQAELEQGDRIEIGDDRLFFLAGPAAPAAAASPAAAAPTPLGDDPDGPPPPDATVIAGAPPVPARAPAPPAPPPAPAGPTFELVHGGETRALGPGAFIVGRIPECDLSLPDDTLVSRRHAQITVGRDEARVRDLGSSNGTRVNGHRIEKEVTLVDGDLIGIGGADLLFKAIRPADPYGATVFAPSPAAAVSDKTMLAPPGAPGGPPRVPGAGGASAVRVGALRALDLPPDAGPDAVRARYQELVSDYQIRLTNAPTPDLKMRYTRRLEELRHALEVLEPAAAAAAAPVEAGNLPASRPVDAPVGVAGGFAAPPAAPPHPSAAAGPAAYGAPAAAAAAPVPPPKAASGFGSLPKSTWVMIGVTLLLILVSAVFAFLYMKVAAVESGLAADLASKQEQAASMEQRIPQAGQALQVLQQVKGSRLENHEVKICNLGTRTLFVEWIDAVGVTPKGAYRDFNSALFGYEKWELAPGGTGKFGYVSGDEVIWDGSAVYFSVLLSYAGEEYFRSGPVETLGIDCYNIDLDR